MSVSKPQLLPRTLSNDYYGSRIAVAFFVLLTVVTLGRSIAHIILPDRSARTFPRRRVERYAAILRASGVNSTYSVLKFSTSRLIAAMDSWFS
jgi:hypothetical protein